MRSFFVSVVLFSLFCVVQLGCMTALAAVPELSPDQERQLSQKSWTGIFQHIEDDLYRIKPDQNRQGAFTAYNQRQACRAGFTDLGLELGPEGSSRPFSLHLKGIGHGDQIRLPALNRIIRSKEHTTRIIYQRQNGVTEWYSNRPEGVEQGFIVRKPLADHQSGPLQVHLAIRQPWQIEVADNQLRFRHGRDLLSYNKLKAWDSRGISLPARMERIDDHTLTLVVEDRKAIYPLYIDPVIQFKKLVADAGTYFGYSVAISGDTVAVMTFSKQSMPGISFVKVWVYIFERNLGGKEKWGLVTKFMTDDPQTELFTANHSIAISGDTIVLGAGNEFIEKNGTQTAGAGAAYVFQRDLGGVNNWGQVVRLTAIDFSENDRFGYSVGIDGDTIVVGAKSDDIDMDVDAGSAYVFQRNPGGKRWRQVKHLIADDESGGDFFGTSIAISGDTIVVGAERDNVGLTANCGSAYIFYRDRGGLDSWGQIKKLIAGDKSHDDNFGNAVAISGDTIVVGAKMDDIGLTANCGSAYVFQRNQYGVDAWGEVKKLIVADKSHDDNFGNAVAISGDTIVVGAKMDDIGLTANCGSAYIFQRDLGGPDSWVLGKKLFVSDKFSNDNFGNSVAISKSTVVIGVPFDDDNRENSGSAYLFELKKSHLWFPVKAANGKTVIIGM